MNEADQQLQRDNAASARQAAFFDALSRDDELSCVMRAHLHIEYLVDMLLAVHIPNTEALQRIHLDYADRVTLLEAFQYLPMLIKPLLAIGTLRNDFAHKLDFTLTSDRMDSLYNSFDPTGKQVIQESYQRTRQKTNEDAPRKMANLSPKSRFALYASSIRTMLELGYKQETGNYPA